MMKRNSKDDVTTEYSVQYTVLVCQVLVVSTSKKLVTVPGLRVCIIS